MRAKFLTLIAALFLLGACETASEDTGGSEGDSSTTSTSSSSGSTTTTQAIPGPTPGSQEDLTVEVGDRVFFDYDSSDLTGEAQETLQRLAIWMGAHQGVTITIEGHADERGTREYNLALGARRAASVRDFLIALNVNPNRVDTISYGKERPAVLGSNEYAWSQNRRGAFVVN